VSALWGLVRKEGLHILRDKRTLAVLILLPVVEVILFGYAIRTDVEDVRLAIVDPTPDYATVELSNRFVATDVFHLVATLRSTTALETYFEGGTIHEAIVFPPRFAEKLARGVPATILVITDASEPNTGSAMQAYAATIIGAYERELRARTQSVRITPQVRMRFNPTRESSNLFVPGLIAFVLTIISALMTAISVTREKETGTMEVLLVSPLRPLQIVLAKVVPYVLLGFASVVAVLLEARLIFHVPIRGSTVLLLVEGLLYILASLALGILISSRTSSQRVAMTAVLAGTMLPNMILSGFIFPLESMPLPLQWVANIFPAKWFVLIARGVMLKGVGLDYLWPETLVLCAFTVILLGISTRSIPVRLE
jgi:ABC-2 type transport system permease protein